MSRAIVHLGGLLSDLTAQLWAFAVENEKGESLVVRRKEIHATLNAIGRLVDAPRSSKAPPALPTTPQPLGRRPGGVKKLP